MDNLIIELLGESIENLFDYCGRRFTLLTSLMIVEQMLSRIEFIHNRGLIHRDISPDNIFMCQNGTFKLIDFGSVKQGINNNNLSATVILKHGYAPIEQYTKTGKVGPWTDIYSLGATIYKLATGVLPQESVERISEDEVVDICELNGSIPRSFGDAVMKALSPQMKDRYQTISEFRAALETDVPVDNIEIETIELDSIDETIETIEDKVETIEDKNDQQEEKTKFDTVGFDTEGLDSKYVYEFETKEENDWQIEETEDRISRIKETLSFLNSPMGRVLITIVIFVIIGILFFIVDPGGEEENINGSSKIKYNVTTEATTKVVTTEATTKGSGEKTSLENSKSGWRDPIYEYFTFGNYWQDILKNNVIVDGYTVPGEDDVKSPIEWRVLKKNDDGTVIAISEKILESRPYNESGDSVTWENSSLRKWLNTYFYDEAFSEEEKKAIKLSTLNNYETGSNDTEDYVYLLSSAEANSDNYGLSESSDRTVKCTDYANIYVKTNIDGDGMWWLRTPGLGELDGLSNWKQNNCYNAQVVSMEGTISSKGLENKMKGIGIRPVICIDISSIELKGRYN